MSETLLLIELVDLHHSMQFPDNWNKEGICANIITTPADEVELLRLFSEYPEYTGDACFPVPGGADRYFALWPLDESARMWDRDRSEYAEERWKLLEWMIEELGGVFNAG